MSETTNEAIAEWIDRYINRYVDMETEAMLREAAARLRQQSEDSARLDALNAMVNGNVDGVEIRQDGAGQCLIVNCENFYGPGIRAVIDKARKA